MNLHSTSPEVAMRRHDLAFVRPSAWCAQFIAREELKSLPLIAHWVDNGWPLIGRRGLPGEGHGIALGLPLPPFAGKRRLSFMMLREDIVKIDPPPALHIAAESAPLAWKPTMARIDALASRHAVDARVFGSLAWRALTGLPYLTDRSDLDLLLYADHITDIHQLVAELADVDHSAPMRLDGEVILKDGCAVNWRELHAGAEELLVKTACDARLLETNRFLSRAVAA